MDCLLANLFDRSVLILANGEEKIDSKGRHSGPISDYFGDADKRIKFAKWFRPMVFLAITVCTHILLISTFQASATVYREFKDHAV